MKIHPCVQGSAKWLALRIGKPTASNFHSIFSPTGRTSDKDTYIQKILAELIMGHPVAQPDMPWMRRGTAEEHRAAEFYTLVTGREIREVGFITNDAETAGCSPDRLVGDDGLLQIKAPAEHTHVGYLIFGDADKKYKPQLQGELWIAERQWVDICSWHPEMPAAIVRVERDEEYIEKLAAAVGAFVERLDELKLELAARDLLPRPAPEPKEFLTQADADAILASYDFAGKGDV